jgi:hypothetical protein
MEKEQPSVVTAAIAEVSDKPIALGALPVTSGDTDEHKDSEDDKENSHA